MEQVTAGEPEIVRLLHQGDAQAALQLLTQIKDGGKEAVDPNYRTAGGWTLLHMAALGDLPEVVVALLDAGADLEADDGKGLRPVHYAVSWDAQEALTELLRLGAELNCASKDQIFYLNKIIPVFVVGGRTPLHLAADKGYNECVKMLLDGGADASVVDWSGRTPYDLAVNNNRLDIAHMLRPEVTQHVAAVPKDFHFDRRGVEARLGKKAPLPFLRPTTEPDSESCPIIAPDPRPVALGSGAAPSPSSPPSSGGGGGGGGRMSLLDDMLRQATAILQAQQQQNQPQ